MAEHDRLADRFQESRGHLLMVAHRILGSRAEAEDAVQEAWLRLSHSRTDGIQNLTGWLTTVVARVCLDILRSRRSRGEELLLDQDATTQTAAREPEENPEGDVLLADAVGIALLTVLETLEPRERVAFVLHDMFDLPFEDIAPVVGRSVVATRQLASRARRRVRGAATTAHADRSRRREIVAAFLAASRGGDFDALLALLDPDVMIRADPAAVHMGAAAEVRGAAAVAQTFFKRALAAQLALVNGAPGLVWAIGGQPRVVFDFRIANERINLINLVADPEHLRQFELIILS